MSAKSIVVGVDGSPASRRAEALAARIGEAAGVQCRPIRVPAAAGQPGPALAAEARRVRAGLVVLGGKRHGAVSRTFGSSTAHHLARVLRVPLLVAGARAKRITRVLAAVDLSEASRPTLAAAIRLAALCHARVRVLHVVEPIRRTSVVPRRVDLGAHRRRSVERFDRLTARYAHRSAVETVLRAGMVRENIRAEAARWKADLIVVGSHGKGFVNRLIIGSTTEWLLNRVSASLLVVPARRDRAARIRSLV